MDQFTLPLKLVCRISGKEVVYTSEDYVKKRLERYGGSVQRMRDEFVCRDAKRLLKEGKNQEQIQKELGTESTPAPEVPSNTIVAENGAEIKIGTEELIDKIVGKPTDYSKLDFKVGKPTPLTEGAVDQCYNPGWFLNKKDCGACAFTKMCNFAKKRTTEVARKR